MMKVAVRPLALSLTIAAGCATPAHDTWDDDHLEGITTRARDETPRPQVAPKATASIDPAGAEPSDGRRELLLAELSDRMELTLVKFREERRFATKNVPGEGRWPAPLASLWHKLLNQLEDDLSSDLGNGLSRRLLLRARVTTEAERDLTERKFGAAPPELAERIGRVHAMITARMREILKTGQEEPEIAVHGTGSGRILWPVTPVVMTSGYGYRRDPVHGEANVRFHSGVDLHATKGDVVYAAATGRVMHAGWWGGYGRMVTILHGNGIETVYAHLNQILVVEGVRIEAGQPVGLVGSSGRSTGPHLHFEVRQWGVPMDPLDAVGVTLASFVKQEQEPRN